MSRKLIRLWEEHVYMENDEYHCIGRECIDMDLAEVTADAIHDKVLNIVLDNRISVQEIQEWIDSQEEFLSLGGVKAVDDDECDSWFELEVREYIQPPFGPLGGKRIYTDDFRWKGVS